MTKLDPVTSRDEEVLQTADCVVVRAWVDSRWRERVFKPAEGQSLAELVRVCEEARENTVGGNNILIYLGGTMGSGERGITLVQRRKS